MTARTDMMLGHREAFEKALLDHYRLTSATPGSVERLNAAKNLHRFYTENGDRSKAEQYLLDFYRIRDSLYSTTGMLTMSDFRLKAELNGINRQVASMNHEKERNRTTASCSPGRSALSQRKTPGRLTARRQTTGTARNVPTPTPCL